MALAPLVVLPLGAAAGLVAWAGDAVEAPPLLTAALAVAVLAFGSGFLHLDGLADTADGLAVQGDRGRRLEVMRRGDVGPVGVVALVLVLLVQVVCAGGTARRPRLCLAVVASRGHAGGGLRPGSPTRPRRRSGERRSPGRCRRSSPRWSWARWRWPPVLSTSGVESPGVAVAVAAAGVLVVVARRRIGGVTGDVLGACVELALAAYLVSQVVVIG